MALPREEHEEEQKDSLRLLSLFPRPAPFLCIRLSSWSILLLSILPFNSNSNMTIIVIVIIIIIILLQGRAEFGCCTLKNHWHCYFLYTLSLKFLLVFLFLRLLFVPPFLFLFSPPPPFLSLLLLFIFFLTSLRCAENGGRNSLVARQFTDDAAGNGCSAISEEDAEVEGAGEGAEDQRGGGGTC